MLSDIAIEILINESKMFAEQANERSRQTNGAARMEWLAWSDSYTNRVNFLREIQMRRTNRSKQETFNRPA